MATEEELREALRTAADELDHAGRILIGTGSIQNGHWAEEAARQARASALGHEQEAIE